VPWVLSFAELGWREKGKRARAALMEWEPERKENGPL